MSFIIPSPSQVNKMKDKGLRSVLSNALAYIREIQSEDNKEQSFDSNGCQMYTELMTKMWSELKAIRTENGELRKSMDNILQMKEENKELAGSVEKLSEEHDTLSTCIQSLKKEVANLKKSTNYPSGASSIATSSVIREISERETNKKHVIIFGVPESENEDSSARKEDDLSEIRQFLKEDLNIATPPIPKLCFRFGEKSKNGKRVKRPIKLIFDSTEAPANLFQSKKRLPKDKKLKFSIAPDLTHQQREDRMKLEEERRKRNQELEETEPLVTWQWVIRGDHLVKMDKNQTI